MRTNKYNTAKSENERAADLTKTFKIMLLLQKIISVTNVPIKIVQ